MKRASLFQIKFAMALDIHMTTLRNVVEQRDYVASTKVIVIMMRIVLVTLFVVKIIVHHPSDPMLIVVYNLSKFKLKSKNVGIQKCLPFIFFSK